MTSLDTVAAAPASTRLPLRETDWRFLLPTPPGGRFGRLLLAGGSPGLVERIAEFGIARHVADQSDTDQPADVVAVLNGARAMLSSLAQRVRPGGVLYFEGSRQGHPAQATPARVARLLQAAGLRPVHRWAVSPGFTERRAFVPLDVSPALRWYLSSFRIPDTARASVLGWGANFLLSAAGRYGAALSHSFAVLAVAGDTHRTVTSVLADPAVSAIIGSAHFRTVLLTHGGDRVVLLPFEPGGGRPVAVLKVPRLAAFNDRTANEQYTLSRLRRDYPWLRGGVPRPLGLVQCGSVNVGVESFEPGRSFQRSSRQWKRPLRRKVADLHAAANWLTDFHCRAELSRCPWSEGECERWIEQPLRAFQHEFGLTDGEADLFARTRSHARTLIGSPLPTVWQHRDFKPSHVFRGSRGVTVLDWEGARPGLPLCDLLHFVVHWHPAVRDVPAPEALSRLLAAGVGRPDRISEAVNSVLREYTRRLRFDGRFVPLLLVYTCVELALRRADQQRRLGEQRDTPRAGNTEFRLIVVLTHYVRELFFPDARHALVG